MPTLLLAGEDTTAFPLAWAVHHLCDAPHAGQAVFVKSCATCHKIYGQGEEVGPDITRNGRNDFRS